MFLIAGTKYLAKATLGKKGALRLSGWGCVETKYGSGSGKQLATMYCSLRSRRQLMFLLSFPHYLQSRITAHRMLPSTFLVVHLSGLLYPRNSLIGIDRGLSPSWFLDPVKLIIIINFHYIIFRCCLWLLQQITTKFSPFKHPLFLVEKFPWNGVWYNQERQWTPLDLPVPTSQVLGLLQGNTFIFTVLQFRSPK